MAHYALDTILLGRHGEIHRGEEIPSTYVDMEGKERDTDFDRLKDLELVSSTKPGEEVEEPEASGLSDDVAAVSAKLEADNTAKQLKAIAKKNDVELPKRANKAQAAAALAVAGVSA